MTGPAFPPEGGRGWRRALPLSIAAALLAIGGIKAAPAAWYPAKAVVAQILLAQSFEQGLAGGKAVRPWPWADVTATARLTVERLGKKEIVLSGGSGEAMAFGPADFPTRHGLHVTLLGAHRETHFAWMRELQVGDVLALERIDGTTARYRVTRLQTVEWDRFAIAARPREETLLLATCFPFDADRPGPLRRVAWAERIA